MCGTPDNKMYIEDLDFELMHFLQMWKEYVSESERKSTESIDCIEWFCSLIRSRLEECRKNEKYLRRLKPIYYLEEDGWLVREE